MEARDLKDAYKNKFLCIIKATLFDTLKRTIFEKVGMLFLPHSTHIEFHNMFNACDVNYSGRVSIDEFKNGIVKINGGSESMLKELSRVCENQ